MISAIVLLVILGGLVFYVIAQYNGLVAPGTR